ncbi:FMN-binding negative transcriptional regulator [Phenylobacterium deserti]|uniref:FMN-binding negative transcriptional regulator n=1 Tax=Phenylobacterium deserti TaxID=1914756 RepID=A0A328A9V8_9CAUL|nr:FMN-binding negative transcriptional regulator [Phenylobacterium deserti]RAK51371.1 FMN-binding negative transcriptional regulator [Phenylobacterium deserti]
MLPPPAKYAPRSDADLLRLVTEHPLAWVVATADLSATVLPLRPVVSAAGALAGFLGHFARSNPQLEVLRAAPRARLLFLGPHGYVSPSWLQDRTQAPSWNYASATFDVTLSFIDSDADLQALMEDVVGAMEAGRPDAWSLAEMGERYRRLSRGVVGFRADLVAARGVFKLGQDERDDVFAELLAGLRRERHDLLAAWMEDFAADRLRR